MEADRLGKYQLVRHLASGGMASVYLARISGPAGFERHVVLKTLRTEGLADPSLIPMFLDEARLAASLHHQHIAQVFDAGSEAGTYFLAMEYIHGETLRRVMETALAQDGLPLGFGVTVACAVAAGLHHAHERRIVHRDVTPSNVIVSYDGSIKVIDFGIAKAADRSIHTRTGFIKGKVGYMAPEQIRGYPVDRRTDVFALGVLAYEMMTLRRAFGGESQFESLERTVHSDLLAPSQVVPGFPQELEDVIMTALEIDPDDRYPDADVMRRDLERVAGRLNLPIGESAVREVIDELFGTQPEPWLARGTGAHESLDIAVEQVEDSVVEVGEELVTTRVPTVDPVSILPLPAPRESAPAIVAPAWSPPPPILHPTAPVPTTRVWTWAVVLGVGLVLGLAMFVTIVTIWKPEPVRAAIPRVIEEPAHAPPPVSRPVPRKVAAVAKSTSEVTVHVTTDRDGATVVLDGVRLGVTPFTGRVPARKKPAWLKVRRVGQIPLKIQVSLERDVTWDVRLQDLH